MTHTTGTEASESSTPFKRAGAEGRRIWHLGSLLTVKATGADTGGRYSIVEYLAPAGPATPLHRHRDEDELFLVDDGELTFVVGDEVIEAQTGDIVHGAAGFPHAILVRSETARFTVVTVPAGFEEFFIDTGEPAGDEGLPPPPAGPPDLEGLTAAAAAHHVEILGPPPDLGAGA